MEMVSLLLPACVAMNIRYKRLHRIKSVCVAELIFQWAKWVLALNLLTMGIITYVFGMDGVVGEAFSSFSFFMKYSFISVFMSLVLPYIVEIVEKYIEISIEIGERAEEKN